MSEETKSLEPVEEKKPVGIKELKEAIDGVLTIGIVITENIKDEDGIVQDIIDIVSNPKVKDAATEAIKGSSEIPAEIKDLSAAEGLELAQCVLKRIPEIINAFKGPRKEGE